MIIRGEAIKIESSGVIGPIEFKTGKEWPIQINFKNPQHMVSALPDPILPRACSAALLFPFFTLLKFPPTAYADLPYAWIVSALAGNNRQRSQSGG